MFQSYSSQSFGYDIRLSGILPNPAILLQDKYESIRHPNVHVDMFAVVNINGQEIKIAVEHQGPQHSSFTAYLLIAKPRDEANGIYKSDAEYRIAWERMLERDRAKVELFEELNRDGYYLIVVEDSIHVSGRAAYILQEFMRQTGLRLGQSDISDWI